MVFYGESIQIQWGANGAGSPVGDFESLYYHFDGASETVTAGQDFTVYTFVDVIELTPADDVVFSWVVECGPGSAGTLQLAHGLDPSWTPDPAYATEDLGSHTVNGTTTIVAPCSLTSADYFAENDAPILHVACTDGSVEVLQVKLRAWPPGGPGGAWTTGDPFTRVGTTVTRYQGPSGGSGPVEFAGVDEAWSFATSEISSSQGSMTDSQGFPSMWREPGKTPWVESHVSVMPAPFIGVTGAGAADSMVFIPRPQPADTGTISPDYPTAGHDPREVWREDASGVRAVGGGTLTPSSIEWLPVTVSGGDFVAMEPVDFEPQPSVPFSGPVMLASPGGAQPLPGSATIIPPGAGAFLLSAYPAEYYSNPGELGQWGGGASFDAPPTFTQFYPAFEWFDPSLPWEEPEEAAPRFFVKDFDGSWAPVGFGKPADEQRVFKVPTAMGLWRDLTAAEYAVHDPEGPTSPGRYPLKVKREDGSWDTVALMVPEA